MCMNLPSDAERITVLNVLKYFESFRSKELKNKY